MVDTVFTVGADRRARLATVYTPDQTGGLAATELETVPFTERPALLEGAVGLVSTVPDYLRFCQMLLNRGELDGARVLKPETVERMTANGLSEPVLKARGGSMGWGLANVNVVMEPASTLCGRVRLGWHRRHDLLERSGQADGHHSDDPEFARQSRRHSAEVQGARSSRDPMTLGLSPERQLATFIAKFDPAVAAVARAAVRKMAQRLPGATQMVYDNYNALAIGFGPSEKSSEAVFSIAVFPRWVSLFFFEGVQLADPTRLLRGSGRQVRHIVLKSADDLDQPAVKELMKEALSIADPPIPAKKKGTLIIKSVSARQRPRRLTTKALRS